MVEANAFARSLVVMRLKVNTQCTSLSSVLKLFKDSRRQRLLYIPQDLVIFRELEDGMHCVSEELTKYYKECKQQSHLKQPKF